MTTEAYVRWAVRHRRHLRGVDTSVPTYVWFPAHRLERIPPGVAARTGKLTCLRVGNGPDCRRLEAMVDRADIWQRAIFTGSVSQHDVCGVIATASVFLSSRVVSSLLDVSSDAMAGDGCVVSTCDRFPGGSVCNGYDESVIQQDVLESQLGDGAVRILREDTRRSSVSHNTYQVAIDCLDAWGDRIQGYTASIRRTGDNVSLDSGFGSGRDGC